MATIPIARMPQMEFSITKPSSPGDRSPANNECGPEARRDVTLVTDQSKNFGSVSAFTD
jgi:hypothetical protein